MKRKSAFSIVELAIVIIIIGLLAGGITAGTKLIRQSKVKTAQKFTKSSPVWEIYNDQLEQSVVAWFDALDEDSITYDADTKLVSAWKSKVSPAVDSAEGEHSATQTTEVNQPLYVRDGMKDFPAIRFANDTSAEEDYLDAKVPLAASDTTISVAIAYTAYDKAGADPDNTSTAGTPGGTLWFQGSSSATAANSYDVQADATNDIQISDASSASGDFAINKLTTAVIIVNGTAVSIYRDFGDEQTTTKTSAASLARTVSYIGTNTTSSGAFFHGDIAEIIVFDKALNSEEAILVRDYMATKYRVN